jgi:hypothetical protein
MPKSKRLSLSWRWLSTQSVLAVYIYVFMEWLFFATKASFMDAMPIWNKLEVLLLTGLILTLPVLLVLTVLRLLGLVPGPTRKAQVFQYVGALLPALFLAAISLLMIDNFTYTIFRFGIVTSRGFVRGVYAAVAIVLLALWYRQSLLNIRLRPLKKSAKENPAARSRSTTWQKLQAWLVLAVLAVSLTIGLVRGLSGVRPTGEKNVLLERQPNIVLLGGDGVSARRMSLYGYERDTTPRLVELAKTGLLSENNFTNAAHTTGSVFSMLTGKYPATTRVVYSPNILQGQDAYQHLPGILQRAGYTTIELTFPYYIDAYTVNMQEGFDVVNGRSIDQGPIFDLARQFHFEDEGYFIPSLLERLSDRLLHIFFIRVMPDPYRQVLQAIDPNTVPHLSDLQKIETILEILRTSDKPIFLHVHLMDTHGGKFYPLKRVFSIGETQDKEWLPDFYDDSILGFDSYAGQLVDGLTESGLIDKTVLVVYSDHADNWRTNDKIPLLFHFPKGEYAGRLKNDTENLDVAPTLLDYLGMAKPTWMAGQSLLRGEPPRMRPIISIGVVGVECHSPDWWCVTDPKLIKPPFYQFGFIQVVVCQKMYTLELEHKWWTVAYVYGHTARCNATDLPDTDQVHQIMVDHLRSNGFDVSSLLK